MEAGARSQGKHGSNNKRNVNRSRACRRIREGYRLRLRAAQAAGIIE